MAQNRWKNRIDGVYVSYILIKGQFVGIRICKSTRQTSLIVKVQSPLAHRSMRRSCANRCGILPDRRFLSVITVLSRRSVRRCNSVDARTFIAMHCVGAASLLP